MKSILVPTDFSTHADYALKTALQLADKSGASIKLIHIVTTPRDVNWNKLTDKEKSQYPETCDRIERSESKLQGIIDNLNEETPVTSSVAFDLTFHQFDKYSRENEIDLIVVGSHGASGFKELFIGSNTQKLVRVCQTPVLTVKNFNADNNFETIIYASSFIEESKKAFPKIVTIAEGIDAKLKLLYINKPNNFEISSTVLNRMKEVANVHPGDYEYTIYNDFTDEEGILAYADSVDADIIAIATHGKRGIRSMFYSLTERLVNHSDKPVLSVSIHD